MRDWALLVVGTVLGIVVLTADLIGLGGYPGIGRKQTAAAAVALVIVLVAAARIVRRWRSGPP